MSERRSSFTRRPFEAPTREALYQAIMSKEPERAKKLNHLIPADLEVVLQCAMGKDRDIKLQLDAIVRHLGQDKYKRAIDGQQQVRTDLQALLELLQSENRSDRLKREQDRYREYIKEIERLQRLERSLRGRVQGGADPERVAGDQGDVAERTAKTVIEEQAPASIVAGAFSRAGKTVDSPWFNIRRRFESSLSYRMEELSGFVIHGEALRAESAKSRNRRGSSPAARR